MSHRDDPDRVLEFTVEHDVGKTPYDAVSQTRVFVQGTALSILFNTTDGGFNFGLQIQSEAGSMLFVVVYSLLQFRVPSGEIVPLS